MFQLHRERREREKLWWFSKWFPGLQQECHPEVVRNANAGPAQTHKVRSTGGEAQQGVLEDAPQAFLV